jgi:hypothetical protein
MMAEEVKQLGERMTPNLYRNPQDPYPVDTTNIFTKGNDRSLN